MPAEDDESWVHAYAIALTGMNVTFHGDCGAVTAVQNSDGSFTASITWRPGGTDVRVYASGTGPYDVAAECASLAAHGPHEPVCVPGDTAMCVHVTRVTVT